MARDNVFSNGSIVILGSGNTYTATYNLNSGVAGTGNINGTPTFAAGPIRPLAPRSSWRRDRPVGTQPRTVAIWVSASLGDPIVAVKRPSQPRYGAVPFKRLPIEQNIGCFS